MNFDEAILYLRRYQDWRKGYDCRPMADAGIDPARLTKAINIILARHGLGKPIRNCELCGEYNAMFGVCYRIGRGEKCETGTDVYGTLRMKRREK